MTAEISECYVEESSERDDIFSIREGLLILAEQGKLKDLKGQSLWGPVKIWVTDGTDAWSGSCGDEGLSLSICSRLLRLLRSSMKPGRTHKGISEGQFWIEVLRAFKDEEPLDPASTKNVTFTFDRSNGNIAVEWILDYDKNIQLKNSFMARTARATNPVIKQQMILRCISALLGQRSKREATLSLLANHLHSVRSLVTKMKQSHQDIRKRAQEDEKLFFERAADRLNVIKASIRRLKEMKEDRERDEESRENRGFEDSGSDPDPDTDDPDGPSESLASDAASQVAAAAGGAVVAMGRPLPAAGRAGAAGAGSLAAAGVALTVRARPKRKTADD